MLANGITKKRNMAIKISTKYLVLAGFCLIVALFSLGMVLGYHYEGKALKSIKNQYSDSLSVIKIKLHGAEATAWQMTQLVVSQKEAIKDLGLKNSDLSKLNIKQANELTELKLKVDTLLHIDHNGQIVVVRDTIVQNLHNALLLPFSFNKTDKWLNLHGEFNSQGKLDISLKMDATFDVVTGYDKEKKPIVTLFTDNTYLKVVSVRSYKTDVVKPKKWFVGFQGGYGFVYVDKKVSLSPYIGAGIGRRLFSF